MADSKLFSGFDEYNRNARLKPAFISTIPVILVGMALGLQVSALAAGIFTPLASLGLTVLIAQLARDVGKKKEPKLFEAWGGKPTTALLRHSEKTLNPLTRDRYHRRLQQLLGQKFPSAREEAWDPQRADLLYDSAGDFLRERTRDTKKFQLLFQELINYGFRRNLWALKPIAICVSGICTVATTALALASVALGPPDFRSWFTAGLNLLLFVCWLFLITPAWVHVAANEYAKRLLAATDEL